MWSDGRPREPALSEVEGSSVAGRGRPALHHRALPTVPKNLLCRARQRRRMSVLQEALLVRPQIPATRIPGFRCRTEKRVREAVGAEKRKHIRAAPDKHAGHADRLPLCGMRRAPAESHRSGRAMPKMRIRPARLQAVRTL